MLIAEGPWYCLKGMVCAEGAPCGQSHGPVAIRSVPLMHHHLQEETRGLVLPTCMSLFAGTLAMQTRDLRALMHCIKSTPISSLFFFFFCGYFF